MSMRAPVSTTLKPSKALFTLLMSVTIATATLLMGLIQLYAPSTLALLLGPFIAGIAMALVVYFTTKSQAPGVSAGAGVVPNASAVRLALATVGLLLIFTLVEYVTLFYWFEFGNGGPQGAFFTGLLLEHAISLVAGVLAGMLVGPRIQQLLGRMFA